MALEPPAVRALVVREEHDADRGLLRPLAPAPDERRAEFFGNLGRRAGAFARRVHDVLHALLDLAFLVAELDGNEHAGRHHREADERADGKRRAPGPAQTGLDHDEEDHVGDVDRQAVLTDVLNDAKCGAGMLFYSRS